MMRKSSIHIKKAFPFAFLHDDREVVSADYFISTAENNECNRTASQAFNHFLFLLDEAVTNYIQRTNQQLQVKSEKFLWEAVVNLESHHTLQDILKLVHILEKKYGWQEVQVSVHKDEGYASEFSGKKSYNYHAHIVFFVLDAKGIYRFKKRDFGKKQMAVLQTLVAEELNMERGVSKLVSKKEHLNHAQYRQIAQEKEDLLFEIKRLSGEVEMFQDLAIEEHQKNLVMHEDLKQLKYVIETLKKTQEELEKEIKKIQKMNDNPGNPTIPSLL